MTQKIIVVGAGYVGLVTSACLAYLGNRVIAVDYPGHGDSEPLKRHYSVEDYADFTVAFMDALNIPKASVLGSSIGGAVAVDGAVERRGVP